MLGALVPFVLLYPVFKLGGLGAGDIKLLAVVGSYLSYQKSISCLIASVLIGGIYALWKLCKGEKKLHMSIPIFLSAIYYMGGFS